MPQQELVAAVLHTHRPRALLAIRRYFQSISIAEDALQDACVKALESWSDTNIPENPCAWLITTAKNAGIDMLRKQSKYVNSEPAEQGENIQESQDELLKLLLWCCHPQLKTSDQIALALKIVCRFSPTMLASSLLISEKTLEQRITRAKRKVSALDTPEFWRQKFDYNQQLSPVLTLIYLIFNAGYNSQSDNQPIDKKLCGEAIQLLHLLIAQAPDLPELQGLLALCLFHYARFDSRLDDKNQLVKLEQQHRDMWDRELINTAQVMLEKALRKGAIGPYQLQASIAAVHCQAERFEDTDWHQIRILYQMLYQLQPTPVVRLNQAVAISYTQGPDAALKLVESLESELKKYLYFHTTVAELQLLKGQSDLALKAFQNALSCPHNQFEKVHIQQQIHNLQKISH